MTKFFLSAILVSLGISAAYAGKEMIDKGGPAPVPCYRDTELNVDFFGSYFTAETRLNGVNADHGWGGGADVNFFFLRYFGVGVEGSVFDVDARSNEFVNLNAYLRFPIEGRICFAPYIFGGGGWEFSEVHDNIHGHAGIGVDFRITPKISIFTDARYTWTGGPRVNNDFGLFRSGLSFSF